MRLAIWSAAFCVMSAFLSAQSPDSQPKAPRADLSEIAHKLQEMSESHFLKNTRQLTFEGKRSGEGYFSGDGTAMVFQSERDAKNPFYQIFKLDLETGDVDRISPGIGKTTCAWIHPDGRRVLYASTHDDPDVLVKMKAELDFRASGKERRYSWDYDEHYELYSHDPRNGKTERLTFAPGYDAEGSYSPDGKWICFASNRSAFLEPLSKADRERFEVDRSLFMDLYIMRADGSEVRRLTTKRGYDGGPFFSADGKRICWRRFSEDGMRAEIYTMNTDGSDKRRLTKIGAMSWAPYFHPSGEYLIFATNKHGFSNFELYVVDAKGECEPLRITYTDRFDGLASFTPDGKTLTWTTQRGASKNSQIFLADWNHELVLKLLRRNRLPQEAPKSRPTSKPTLTGESMQPLARAQFMTDRMSERTAGDIRAYDLKHHLETLASTATNGRFTGTLGERLAVAYVAGRFESLGLQSHAIADKKVEVDGKSFQWKSAPYLQPFPFKVRGGHGNEEMEGTGYNVIGVLDSLADEKDELPAIVIGAHIDHLGEVGGAYSRSAGDNKKLPHHGADDNASGVAAMLELAEKLAAMQKSGKFNSKRDVIFCAWSGEEIGLFGSNFFVKSLWESKGQPEHLRSHIAAYLNMDMVGRLDRKLTLQGIGSSSVWMREIERRNAGIGLPISTNEDVYLPTDTMGFYLKGVPILAAFTGAHTDYHKHTDTIDKINYEGLTKITRFMTLVTRGLALSDEAPDYIHRERKKRKSASSGQRIYLGTIPDYAEAPIPGLQLSGVQKNGPAEKAGIKGGDIVVELAGVEVTDIHTYMDAFAEMKIGKPSKVVVVRKGKKVTLEITPGVRE